eukprot:6199576-Pleurochrysis_carterae.AAC.2
MMYKWGYPVATLPSDKGDYISHSQNDVNSFSFGLVTAIGCACAHRDAAGAVVTAVLSAVPPRRARHPLLRRRAMFCNKQELSRMLLIPD